MKDCKKCKKVVKKVCYPDNFSGYTKIVSSEVLSIYKCDDCGRYIKNTHKRYGYQTEYLPCNEIIDEAQVEELKLLNNL